MNQAPKKTEDQKFWVNVSSFQGIEVLKISGKKGTRRQEQSTGINVNSEEPSARESWRQNVLRERLQFPRTWGSEEIIRRKTASDQAQKNYEDWKLWLSVLWVKACCSEDQVPKPLKTEVLRERLHHSRTWSSEEHWPWSSSEAIDDLKLWWVSSSLKRVDLKTKCQRLWRLKFWWKSPDSTGLKLWWSRQRFSDPDQTSSTKSITQVRRSRQKKRWLWSSFAEAQANQKIKSCRMLTLIRGSWKIRIIRSQKEESTKWSANGALGWASVLLQ